MDYDDSDDYSISDGFEDDNYEDPLEEWEDRCGYDPQYAGVCWHVGTEDCSFFCPFHNIHFKKAGE